MTVEDKPTCGVVMPISAIEGLDESHWIEVFAIISDAALTSGFEANIVSNADEVGVIQKRIVENLYLNPIVICDVSAKNPNVMFELGMRLAFDKPTIIIKDDKTSYSFDTSPIEHLTYPRDLRFSKIVEFKSKLSKKLTSTIKSAKDDSYSPFLKHFGEFKVAKLDTKEVGETELIFDEVRSLRKLVERLGRQQDVSIFTPKNDVPPELLNIWFPDLTDREAKAMRGFLQTQEGVSSVRTLTGTDNITYFDVGIPGHAPAYREFLMRALTEFLNAYRKSAQPKTKPSSEAP